mgnify:CR=1 FL=1
MEQTNERTFLETEPVGKLLLKLALPTVAAQLINMMYNIVDRMYIGHIPGDGAMALTGVGVCMPLIMVVSAFAALISNGGAPRATIFMGKGEKDKAEKTLGNCFCTQTIVSLILTAFLLAGNRGFLLAFGASENTIEYANSYITIYLLGNVFVMMSLGLNSFINAQGFGKTGMLTVVIGAVLNIILDPIFISGFGMGAAGAAIATTIGNIMASVYYLWYFCRKSRNMSMAFRYFKCGDRILSQVCSAGLPTAIFSALMSISTIILNQILVAYGNAPVAAIGIVFKANMFITFLQMGLANGVQPLLGYSYGAGNRERFIAVERYTKKCCLIVGVLATALFFFFREPIIRLFISDTEVINYGVEMLIAYMISGPVIGILFMNMNCMQSTGNALPATILSILRQGVLLIPVLYGLNALLGLHGVIYGQALTDYVAVLLSIVIWRWKRRKTL